MNKVFLIGRTTKEIELRTTQNDKMVANFTLAVNRNKEEADFISCVAWGKTAELLAKYVNKGDKIAVSGRIQARSYDAQDGKRVYVTEVVAEDIEFLESKRTEPKAEPVVEEYTGEFVPF